MNTFGITLLIWGLTTLSFLIGAAIGHSSNNDKHNDNKEKQ